MITARKNFPYLSIPRCLAAALIIPLMLYEGGFGLIAIIVSLMTGAKAFFLGLMHLLFAVLLSINGLRVWNLSRPVSLFSLITLTLYASISCVTLILIRLQEHLEPTHPLQIVPFLSLILLILLCWSGWSAGRTGWSAGRRCRNPMSSTRSDAERSIVREGEA